MVAPSKLAERIIHEQELIIGPLAWREAKKVPGISVGEKGSVALDGDAKKILGNLVKQYEGLFGPASREICREAVRSLLPEASPNDIPVVLK